MASDITNFKQNFSGSRPNRFIVEVTPGSALGGGPTQLQNFDLYCKATTVPGSQIGVIPLPWMGRVIKFPGERTYADWTIQCYDSTADASDLRKVFESWINLMDSRDTHDINYSPNVYGSAIVSYSDVKAGVGVHNAQTAFTKKIKLTNLFPTDLSPLDLSYDVSDTFAEFSVTFAYDYWEIV